MEPGAGAFSAREFKVSTPGLVGTGRFRFDVEEGLGVDSARQLLLAVSFGRRRKLVLRQDRVVEVGQGKTSV